MPNDRLDTDVLIVGAGPVGLFLANECGRHGLRWRLIESHCSQSEHSKALAIFPRTMEIFDMAGVVASFLKAANRVTSVVVLHCERTLARMHFAPEQSPYPFVAMVPQNVTEALLLEELKRKGGAVEYETSFVSAVQHGDSVRATLEKKGSAYEIEAKFVVGCDGAHSAVRRALKLSFEGGDYEDSFLLADIETNNALPADELQLCPHESGPLAIFPMSASRRRIIATVKQTEGDAPPLDQIRKVLAERGPGGLEARALNWSSYFRIHHRHVGHLRAGRMFVAGDAAHIHSPFGGQGMNTGLHDAWNLAWKLDFALRGIGNERLLDSYNAERLPVIRNVIETTDHLTKIMGTPNRLAQALRDTIIPMVSRLAPFQHAFVQRLSELGVAYRGSPIVEGPGNRYFDESVRGGNGIRGQFLLFVGKEQGKAAEEAAKQFCDALRDIVELRSTEQAGIALVRPDGYLAYSTHSRDIKRTLEEVGSVLERQLDVPKVAGTHSAGAAS